MSRYLDASFKAQMVQIMVQYGRPSRSSWSKTVWSSFCRTIMGKSIRKSSIETWMGESSKLRMLNYSCLWMWTTWNWLGRNKTLTQCGKYLWKKSTWASQDVYFRLHSTRMRNGQRYCGQVQKDVWIQDLCRSRRKVTLFTEIWRRHPPSWSYDMEGHAKKCVERYCEQTNKTYQQLYKVATHALMTINSKKKNWDLLENCQKYALKIVLKFTYLTRTGRPDILL